MKKLLVYLKDYKKESILAPLFKMLEASFELIVPLVVTAMIDVGIADKNSGYILKMCLVMVALGLIGLLCSVTAQYFAAKAAAGFGTRVRHQLFAHIQSFSFTEIDQEGTATLITRMTSDINQVQSGVNMVLRLFLRSPFIVFGAMVMAFTIDWKAALIFAVAIPLLSLVVFGVMAVSIPLYRKVQERLDKVLGITRENLTGARVIRAFHKEEEEKARFEEGLESLTSMQNHVGKISAFMNPVTYVIINGATILLLYTGAVQVDAGSLTQGEVVALVNYMSQILVELIKLANLIVTITKAVACGNRVESILEIQSSMPADGNQLEHSVGGTLSSDFRTADGSPLEYSGGEVGDSTEQSIGETGNRTEQLETENQTGTPAVEFAHVGLTYQGAGGESLSDIDFSVKKGETIGIIGGTGSGKTSLVHLIPRFYDVTSGAVLLNGRNVREYPLEELRQKVGIVMQRAVLFKGTIRENLCWGKADASEEELYEALEIAQAKEVVEGKEGSLNAPVEQGGKNFSGGQRQRLTIARALVRKPEILILDDSASALDYATDAKLRKSIREMEGSPTVFIVSQRTSSIQHADKIIVLEDGEVAGIGTHQQLLESCGVYREIYESQYKKQ
ncbi:ABC transporter ATP-binding protein [Petralouisia muris]|uniref:ABC transporter ATP-binding protein n=1 Tax=Petralouisia muris TaxID=3032872 RepID=A0AC61RRX6_9FIRM|nr:ABC transporter ATP-binding protein [Petralouisia muris]TGY91994.1 ABC transporter ATP-binding protein [Petralouisia muris]